ncbi:MAG: hypothetical protein WBA10_03435 [Elainellaceae cyanobacterium]
MAAVEPDLSKHRNLKPDALEAGDRLLFRISPLVRITLLGLYATLLFPVPVLAQVTAAPISPGLLSFGVLVGGVLLYGALAERVIVDNSSIQVAYPKWVPTLLRSGWSLRWSDIDALKPRSTGQGGIVYYFVSTAGDRAYLLPMRVAGFSKLVSYVQLKTDIDTTDVRPLAQPWMYIILLGLTLILGMVDVEVLWMALSHQFPPPL